MTFVITGAVPGLPFDEAAGVLPNVAGRVVDPATGDPLFGVYCSGWIKRGPTGMIGTNKTDSAQTVETLLDDYVAGQLEEPVTDRENLEALLERRGVAPIDAAGWLAIDLAERKAGRESGRTRAKLVSVEELVRAARSARA